MKIELLKELNDSDFKVIFEAKPAFKVSGGKIVRVFRCTGGRRKGKLVSNPADCFKRKDVAKARRARISSKKSKFSRVRKSKLTKKKALNKTVKRMNSK